MRRPRYGKADTLAPEPPPAGSFRRPGSSGAEEALDASETRSASRGQRAGAAAKPLTGQRIRNIAEHYIGQRESSARMLRNTLERRLQRRLRELDPDAAAEEQATALPLIEAEIQRLQAAGLIDDARYAEMKARSGLGSGRGARRILRDLGQKGIESTAARDALLEAAREVVGKVDDPSEALAAAELESAEVFARKRRLGPYRRDPLPEASAERSRIWRREAGAMARAGFGVDTIRRVLDREPEEE